MERHDKDIRGFTKTFALRIIKLCKFLLDKYRGDLIIPVLAKQILRSGTSVAANVAESKNAQSKNDFINKLTIALKEADETALWLDLLHESDYLTVLEYESIYDDNQKIIATLINIIKKTKNGDIHG